MTVSGARTGVVGGAVPEGGAVLSTVAMKALGPLSGDVLEAGAGATLDEISRLLERDPDGPRMFYPPDPTETTASIGGTIATDASGSSSYLYGSTRRWILWVELALADGSLLRLERGDWGFDDDGLCRHPSLGEIRLPAPRPRLAKDAAGLWMRQGMDLVDLVVGSEGTLGVVTRAGLRLRETPGHVVDSIWFLPGMEELWELFDTFRRSPSRVRALELMDDAALDFLRNHPVEDVPPPPGGAGTAALLARVEAAEDASLDAALEEAEGFVERLSLPEGMVWIGLEPGERKKLRSFRHALPESANREISRRRLAVPGIHKLGSDSAVPVDSIREYYTALRRLLEESGLEHLVFGHLGEGHPHANLLPASANDLARGESVMVEIARLAVRMGGTVSAEHGLGRMKSSLAGIAFSNEEREAMRLVRRAFDPEALLGPCMEWA
ncbi:FAD-binding protein [Candidatus Fermentibacterales bacterium]|nr:FAD-binding protein [Candidatus Fermentibacterales bacterium]